MTRPTPLRNAVALVASLFGIGCSKGPPSRYSLQTDPASRYGFQYVRDRVTGRWVYRELELRVDSLRALPDPISDDASGDRLSLQLFKPGTAETGGLRSGVPEIEEGHRVWRGADVVDKADMKGEVAYGVVVSWPRAGEETRYDPMEVFPLPPLGETAPGEWSPWFSAASLRPGAFGWWAQAHGQPEDSLPKPEHPFELRWRLVLADVPGRIP